MMCSAICKSGLKCPFKGRSKFNGFCGKHFQKPLEDYDQFLAEAEQQLFESTHGPDPSTLPKPSDDMRRGVLMERIEGILTKVNMDKQYRDKKKKDKFNLKWAFLLGNTCNALGAGPFTTPHNFKKGRGVCLTDVEDRALPEFKKELWRLSKQLMKIVDPDFVEGEYVVNYACMNDPDHYVKKHVDGEDISFQYAMSLGDHQGAKLRCYDSNDAVIGDFDYHYKICKMDGRLPHEVILEEFKGTRFVVVWFKVYDHRKPKPDAIFERPHFV